MKYCAYNPDRPCDSDCVAYKIESISHKSEYNKKPIPVEIRCLRLKETFIVEPQEEKELPSLEESLKVVNKMLNEKMDSMNKEPKRCVADDYEVDGEIVSFRCSRCGNTWFNGSLPPICKHQEGE